MEIIIASFISTLIGGAAGYYIYRHFMIKTLVEIVQDQITVLKYEISDGQHFLYFDDNQEFASQGATLDEAAQNYSKNCNLIGHVKLPPDNMSPFFIINGQIEAAAPTVQ